MTKTICGRQRRSWDWHPERAEKVPFGRSYSTSASRNPLYMFSATLRNYFEHDFGNKTQIPAIDLRADQERFTFRSGERVVVPITVRFLEDMRVREWRRKQGQTTGELKPIVEGIIDHPTNLGLWGVRVELLGERAFKQPAISAAFDQISERDFAARIRGEPGFQAEEEKKLVAAFESEPGWSSVEFSAAVPYQRMLDIGSIYDFTQPGDYRVQIDYESTRRANRSKGEWVGSFSSPVFGIKIVPAE